MDNQPKQHRVVLDPELKRELKSLLNQLAIKRGDHNLLKKINELLSRGVIVQGEHTMNAEELPTKMRVDYKDYYCIISVVDNCKRNSMTSHPFNDFIHLLITAEIFTTSGEYLMYHTSGVMSCAYEHKYEEVHDLLYSNISELLYIIRECDELKARIEEAELNRNTPPALGTTTRSARL